MPENNSDNILHRANDIINNRSEEKEREYGPFNECMDDMRDIFNAMTGHKLTTQDMYAAMIAVKLARQKFKHKSDNLLDIAAYIGALDNYENK